jgi:acyl dehydratase
MTIDFHSVATGDVLPAFSMTVSADEVRDYVRATGEDTVLWLEAGIVPPLAALALTLAALTDEMPLPAGVIHSGQEVDFLQPIPIDAEITGYAVVDRRSERAGVLMTQLGFELHCEERLAARGKITIVMPTTAPVGVDA